MVFRLNKCSPYFSNMINFELSNCLYLQYFLSSIWFYNSFFTKSFNSWKRDIWYFNEFNKFLHIPFKNLFHFIILFLLVDSQLWYHFLHIFFLYLYIYYLLWSLFMRRLYLFICLLGIWNFKTLIIL